MKCSQARRLMDDKAVLGALEAAEEEGPRGAAADLGEHLAVCEACTRQSEVLRRTSELMVAATSEVGEADLAPDVLRRIRQARANEAVRPFGRLRAVWAACPVEWQAVPFAAGMCLALFAAWFAVGDPLLLGQEMPSDPLAIWHAAPVGVVGGGEPGYLVDSIVGGGAP